MSDEPAPPEKALAVVQLALLALVGAAVVWLTVDGGAARVRSLLASAPRANVAGRPRPAASGAGREPAVARVFTPDHGLAPVDRDLVWYTDPTNGDAIQAADWSGRAVGTINLPAPPAFDGQRGISLSPPTGGQSPNGQLLLVYSSVMDSRGRVLLGGDQPWRADGTGMLSWADDSRHFCALRNSAANSEQGPGTLRTIGVPLDPGAPLNRDLRQVGVYVGQSGPEVAVCGLRAGRAVVLQRDMVGVREAWLVDTTTGRVLADRRYGAQEVGSVVASPDGRWIAEQSLEPFVSGTEPPRPTIIRDAVSGVVQASLASDLVQAFSNDGTLALVSGPRVINWRTRRELWAYSGSEWQEGVVLVSPDAEAFALAFRNPPTVQPAGCDPSTSGCTHVDDPAADILIVRGDGSTTPIDGRHNPFWMR